MRILWTARIGLALVIVTGIGLMSALNAEDPPKPAAEGTKPEVAKSDGDVKMVFAVKPKELTPAVKKGLEYLVKNQHENGGWGQGGGWRNNLAGGGRVEGENVADPPDVGNTCIALLALMRSGSTPSEGPYAKNVAKGLSFVMSKVEASDDKSLEVTDVKGTQLQGKIGPYVDTFLTAMVLAEAKGKGSDQKFQKRLVAAATKTISKMEKNQQKNGTFAGNGGWAPVLSQGIANKAFNYARQNDIQVSDGALRRVEEQVAGNFDTKTGTFTSPSAGAGGAYGGAGDLSGIPATSGRAALGKPGVASAAPGDAGVALYSASQGVTNAGDVLRSYRLKEKSARDILARKDAPKEERERAKMILKDVDRLETLNDQATAAVVKQVQQADFVGGFGSNGGEEFLSFMNISETLLLKGGKDWNEWDTKMTKSIDRAQNGDGSWSGQHCITGKTFCTAAALLVVMSDRTPFPADVLKQAREPKKEETKPEETPATPEKSEK